MITLQIDCFDWDKDTEHDLIGSFETTLRELAPAKDREVGSIISLEWLNQPSSWQTDWQTNQ